MNCRAPPTSRRPTPTRTPRLPAHRGAAAYIDGTERTFLEKYSDYLWGAILLLSGLGSAGAWFRSYLKRDEKAENIALRDRVLALSALARDGNSAAQLRDMQHEVDAIIRQTLEAYDDGAIEEGDLSAFGLALEQFHRAVADRHEALDQAGSDQPTLSSRVQTRCACAAGNSCVPQRLLPCSDKIGHRSRARPIWPAPSNKTADLMRIKPRHRGGCSVSETIRMVPAP